MMLTLCISVLSSPYAVFHYPVQAMFQFSMYFGAIFMMCSVQCVFPCYPLLVLCFSSVCIFTLSCPCYVSVQRVFPCYPLLVLCFSAMCIFTLSCPWCVSVQHVFWCCPLPMTCLVQRVFPYYPLLMMCSVQCVSPCYPLLVLCFSSACILVLSLWCVQFSVSLHSPWYNHTGWLGVKYQLTYLRVSPCYPLLMPCFSSAFISTLSYPSSQRPVTWRAGSPKLLRTTLEGQLCIASITLWKVASCLRAMLR